ncbi:hypothetical protein AD931_02570 [Gluconobacter oxydans]|uniref:Uncharacterized protein n=1 Tax=Gluconobacter oxydans TaxID=442 RepID=A0AB34XJ83_GLUOY|nr:hypothetical protein AD931_02570 [Gluconobacter oxydans]
MVSMELQAFYILILPLSLNSFINSSEMKIYIWMNIPLNDSTSIWEICKKFATCHLTQGSP